MRNDLIKEICDNFYSVTGLTTFYINSSFEITEFSKGFTMNQLYILDIKEVIESIKEKFINNLFDKDTFITCSTRNHFIYNLCYIEWEKGEVGVVVSGAMTILPTNDSQINTIFDLNRNSISRTDLMELMTGVTTVTYLHLHNLGKNLYSVVHTLTKGIKINQQFDEDLVLKKCMEDHIDNLAEYQLSSKIGEYPNISSDVYSKLKNIVTNGDVEGMKLFVTDINFTPIDQLIKSDSLRSIKTSSIIAAVLCFTFAMEANAPYYKLYSITLSFLNQTEKLNSDQELLLLIKNIFLSYTKIVSLTAFHSYSRPVKLAIQYIQKNYYKTISLSELSKHAGVSSYYLSSLIKKETSLSLTDHFHKVRVEASKYLLLNTDLTILEIAQNTGFNYQNHYSAIFKKMVGVSPTVYRKQKNEK